MAGMRPWALVVATAVFATALSAGCGNRNSNAEVKLEPTVVTTPTKAKKSAEARKAAANAVKTPSKRK